MLQFLKSYHKVYNVSPLEQSLKAEQTLPVESSHIPENFEISKYQLSVSQSIVKDTESNFKKKKKMSIHLRVVLTSLLAGWMVFPSSLVQSWGENVSQSRIQSKYQYYYTRETEKIFRDPPILLFFLTPYTYYNTSNLYGSGHTLTFLNSRWNLTFLCSVHTGSKDTTFQNEYISIYSSWPYFVNPNLNLQH